MERPAQPAARVATQDASAKAQVAEQGKEGALRYLTGSGLVSSTVEEALHLRLWCLTHDLNGGHGEMPFQLLATHFELLGYTHKQASFVWPMQGSEDPSAQRRACSTVKPLSMPHSHAPGAASQDSDHACQPFLLLECCECAEHTNMA